MLLGRLPSPYLGLASLPVKPHRSEEPCSQRQGDMRIVLNGWPAGCSRPLGDHAQQILPRVTHWGQMPAEPQMQEQRRCEPRAISPALAPQMELISEFCSLRLPKPKPGSTTRRDLSTPPKVRSTVTLA